MVQVTQPTFPPPPPPPLLSAYPFMDSLHPFMSIFPISQRTRETAKTQVKLCCQTLRISQFERHLIPRANL